MSATDYETSRPRPRLSVVRPLTEYEEAGAAEETFAKRHTQTHHSDQHAGKSARDSDTEAMSDMNREELHAHLENQELRVEKRLSDFEGRIVTALGGVSTSLQLLNRDLEGVRGIKTTIIVNSVLSVIAIAGIVIGVLAYGVSSHDSGRDTAAMVQELKQQSAETRRLIEDFQKAANVKGQTQP